jgi:four helix bundle protein
MKYTRFEDLPVWNDAIAFAVKVFALTGDKAFNGFYSLRNQLERAAISISNNVAEGFERGTTPELLTFIYIARGSAGECRSVLYLSSQLPAFRNLKSEISDLRSKAESISRQLRAWANSLQNSNIRGQRHLNDKTRRASQFAREREEFLKELEEINSRRVGNQKND